jgi:hypothetical protein
VARKATHVLPRDVTSPKDKIGGHPEVIYDSGENNDDNEGFAVAWVNYEGKKRICMRWNGNEQERLGFPNARGYATWDVVPYPLAPFVEYVALQLQLKKEAFVPNKLEALMKGIKALGYNVTVSA